ncbi:MAG: divergent polysaccharide deacetylase family protein [Elusimicrobiota bacterium]
MKKIFRLLLIIIIVAAISYYLRRKPEDLSALSNNIDIKINSILTDFGITDVDVLACFRTEEKTKKARWVKVTKKIRTKYKYEDIVGEIKIGLEQFGVEIEFAENTLVISKAGLVLNKIFFVPLEIKVPKFKAAIIIDDLGYKKDELKTFLELGIPLTYTILPYERYSSYLADELKSQSQEYFLHQPMEPEGYPKTNPGKTAILVNMSAKEIEKKILENLKNIDGAKGINNHMGSMFTQNKAKMEIVLKIVKTKNLIFVDSHTTPKSVAYKTAKTMGITALQNEVFLDNKDNLDYILNQLSIFKNRIKKNGQCVAIGHIHRKNTPIALAKIIPEFQKERIEFLTVSEYLESELLLSQK